MIRRAARMAGLLAVTGLLGGCGPSVETPPPPDPALDAMEPRVAERMRSAREELLADPESSQAWGRLGSVYAAHDLHREAELCYAQAARIAPADFRWSYLLAITRAFNGASEEEIIELFGAASELRGDYVPLYVRLGRALAKRGSHEKAIVAFATALELQPGFPPAEIGAGQSWLGLGDAESALPHLERVARVPNVDARGLLALSQAYRMLGREAEALRVAEQAKGGVMRGTFHDPVWEESVEAEGISSSACYKRARRRIGQGRHEDAIQDLLIVEEVEPGRAGVQAMLGSAYRGLGRPDTAIEHFSRAVELRDDQAWVRHALGELLEEQGRLEEALANFRRAAQLDPKAAAYYVATVRVQSALNDLRGAILTLRLGIRSIPDNPDLHFLMGLALRDAGRVDRALLEFERVLQLEPPTARTRYELGLTLEKAGRVREAVAQYRAALALDPEHKARKRLKSLAGTR